MKLSATYASRLSTPFHLSCTVMQSQPPSLCCPRAPLHHPSNVTSVYSLPVIHLIAPSTPCKPYGTHPLSPHVQTISILYLSTPFLLQLYLVPPNSNNCIHSWHSHQTFQHFISRTFSFFLSALFISHALK